MLHETRIVLIEKIEQQKGVLFVLKVIDEEIKIRISSYHGQNAFIPKGWLKNKMIRKVLENNGYEIFDDLTKDGNIDQGLIIHKDCKKLGWY